MTKQLIILLVIVVLSLTVLAGCQKDYEIPESEFEFEPVVEPVAEPVEETAAEPEVVKPVKLTLIQSLQEKTSKVKSLEYFYSGEAEGLYKDVKSKRSRVKRYGTVMRLEIQKQKQYMPEDVFDVVFLDTQSKTAYAWCEDTTYCTPMEELKEVQYADYYFEDPIDLTLHLAQGEVKQQELFEINKQTNILQYEKDGNIIRYWVWDFNGLTLQREIEKPDGEITTLRYENVLTNKLKKEDVYPPADVMPSNFGTIEAPVEEATVEPEEAETEEAETEEAESETTFANVYGANFDDDMECTPVRGGMSIREDTKLCPGTYELETGINLFNSDLTLDCNGAVLVGSSKVDIFKTRTGITIPPKARKTVIRNCVIKDFYRAVSIGSDSNILYNNEITENMVGVLMEQSDDIYYTSFETEPNKLVENNIYDNRKKAGSEPTYDFVADSVREVIGNNNYWGTDDCDALRKSMSDDEGETFHTIIRDRKTKSTTKALTTDTILNGMVGVGEPVECPEMEY